MIKTCQQLHESGGDAEAYDLSVLLASKPVIYGLVLLSEVLDILAKFNATMQRKSIDISRISSLLQVFLVELEGLREATAEWCSKATSLTLQLEKEHNLTLLDRRTRTIEQVDCIQEFRRRKAIPYLDCLIVNIRSRFEENAVKVLTAFSIFNPNQFPSENDISSYGLQEIKVLADFYGSNATVEFEGTIFSSPPLLDHEELMSEWKTFRRALLQEKQRVIAANELSTSPSLEQVFLSMQSFESYRSIFPQTCKLVSILLTIPVGTATMERSFSHMKIIKNRLRNRLSDASLDKLMRVAIEGPDLSNVNFSQILDIFKLQNRFTQLQHSSP